MPFDTAAYQNDPDLLKHHSKLSVWSRSVNIAEERDFDNSQLQRIGTKVKREYEIDWQSCSEWRTKYKEYMEFALQIAEEKTYPWPGASNVIFPLLTVSAIQFAARAYPAIINGPKIVKGVVVGQDDGIPVIDPQTNQPAINPQTGAPIYRIQPGVKRQRADAVAAHMSYQLLYEQKEWEEDTDTLLHILPIVGCLFRKSYFDSGLGRNCSYLIHADKLVINYHAKSFYLAPRLTEELLLYPIEIEEKIRAGIFIDQKYPSTPDMSDTTQGEWNYQGDDDAPVEFLEQHRRLDLDEDGYAEPYIVTVQKATSKVARIVADYDADGVFFKRDTNEVARITPVPYYTRYNFLPSLDSNVYGMGLGRLLNPINAAVNTTLNQMIDAGHLQIRGGGFIGKSLSMNTGNVRFAMGEYKTINVTGQTLKDNLIPLNFPGPSDVLFQLLGLLIDAGKEVASVKDVLTGDITAANIQATTMMALIEQGLKVFTAIYKRVYRSLKSEYEKNYRLNRIYLEEESGYKQGDNWKQIKRSDYNNESGVEPVADPTMVSDMQRFGRAQFLLQFAGNPFFKGYKIFHDVLEWTNFTNIDEYLNQNPQPNPAILAKISEVASRSARDRAGETRDIAQAILYLAQARKVSDDAHIAWFDQQLEIFRTHLEASQGPQGGPGPPPPQSGQTAPGLPNLPPQSSPNMLANLPQLRPLPNLPSMPGLPSGAPPSVMNAPSLAGARMARDGNLYIPDQNRPGKFLMRAR